MPQKCKAALSGLLIASCALLFGASYADAVAPPSPAPVSVLAGSVSLSATNVSSRVALPSTSVSAIALTICNTGSKDAFVAWGDNTVVATTSSPVVKAGGGIVMWTANPTNVAGITGGSDTTSLTIYQGNGPLAQCPDGVASGAGSVTAGQGAPNAGGANAWPVQGGIAAGAADSNNPIKVGGVYNASPSAVTTGNRANAQTDAYGDFKFVQVDGNSVLIDPTLPVQTYQSNSYTNITTKTNTQMKASAGTLVRIVINKVGTADTLMIKDTTAADCSGGVTLGTVTVQATAINYPYDATTVNGLCVTSGGTTAGDYTVIWR